MSRIHRSNLSSSSRHCIWLSASLSIQLQHHSRRIPLLKKPSSSPLKSGLPLFSIGYIIYKPSAYSLRLNLALTAAAQLTESGSKKNEMQRSSKAAGPQTRPTCATIRRRLENSPDPMLGAIQYNRCHMLRPYESSLAASRLTFNDRL